MQSMMRSTAGSRRIQAMLETESKLERRPSGEGRMLRARGERERNRERGEGRVFGWACYIGRRTVLLQDLPRLRFRIRGISAAAVLSP